MCCGAFTLALLVRLCIGAALVQDTRVVCCTAIQGSGQACETPGDNSYTMLDYPLLAAVLQPRCMTTELQPFTQQQPVLMLQSVSSINYWKATMTNDPTNTAQ
jgi:hypothetical protein